jgi:hypothetical protein
MELASIINQYYDAFTAKYAKIILPDHLKALRVRVRITLQNWRSDLGQVR